MSSVSQPVVPLPIPNQRTLPVRLFSVDEYHQMIQIGLLTDADRVELLEGLIVPKMPHSPQHDGTIQLVHAAVRRPLDAAWELRIQSAITLLESEPEPDIAVVPGPAARYLQRHPGPLDIAMLIEIADTSLGRHRCEKGQVYASAGIVIYWIVNLADRCVEVYTDPSGPNPSPSFRQRRDYGVGDQVPLVIQGKTVSLIPVADMVA